MVTKTLKPTAPSSVYPLLDRERMWLPKTNCEKSDGQLFIDSELDCNFGLKIEEENEKIHFQNDGKNEKVALLEKPNQDTPNLGQPRQIESILKLSSTLPRKKPPITIVHQLV